MHLIVIAVPVPQIREQIIDVIKVDVPVSKILVEIVDPVAYRRQAKARVDVHFPVAYRRQATARVDVHFPVPRILEQIVEVILVILQEQCQ